MKYLIILTMSLTLIGCSVQAFGISDACFKCLVDKIKCHEEVIRDEGQTKTDKECSDPYEQCTKKQCKQKTYGICQLAPELPECEKPKKGE